MIYAKFVHPNAGYEHDRLKCKRLGLEVDKEYKMAFIRVGNSSSTVFLEEFPDDYFNSVHFEYYEYVGGICYGVDIYLRFYEDPYL